MPCDVGSPNKGRTIYLPVPSRGRVALLYLTDLGNLLNFSTSTYITINKIPQNIAFVLPHTIPLNFYVDTYNTVNLICVFNVTQ